MEYLCIKCAHEWNNNANKGREVYPDTCPKCGAPDWSHGEISRKAFAPLYDAIKQMTEK